MQVQRRVKKGENDIGGENDSFCLVFSNKKKTILGSSLVWAQTVANLMKKCTFMQQKSGAKVGAIEPGIEFGKGRLVPRPRDQKEKSHGEG